MITFLLSLFIGQVLRYVRLLVKKISDPTKPVVVPDLELRGGGEGAVLFNLSYRLIFSFLSKIRKGGINVKLLIFVFFA